ncbi:hypothetical protein J3U87_29115 [Sulfidibacter corallicola]|uniref:Uncharacterized protein n=1 Tax=Sulfidibacter corallicola TaxID=2818388 RepID=A0A8A4TJ87_SULCO|nr:hypothetical protein [Sulfidibacter corallicola]QTD49663.1 hypothetical protein J3U87_29115 [Sulfidibacter corallicola]
MTNERLVRKGEAINKVFENCVLRIGEKTDITATDVLDLLAGDRLALLIELRKVSLGSDLDLNLTCTNPACGHEQVIAVDLGQLPVRPYPSERDFSVVLPSQTRITFGLLDGHAEKRLAAIAEPTVSTALMMRIRTINDQPPTKKTLADLSMRDRVALRREMQAVDGGVDTSIDHACEACGTRLTTRVEVEPDFLFPNLR